MIDKKRLDEYNAYLKELQEGLSSKEFFDTLGAKLMDIVSRGGFEGEALKTYFDQVKKQLDTEMHKLVDRIEKKYSEILTAVNTQYADIGYDVSRDFPKIKAIEQINRAQLGDYSKAAAKEIAKTIREGIMDNLHHTEIADKLRKINEEVAPYADTLARTQVKGYGQACKIEKARLGDTFFYEYVGRALRVTSHVFCRELFDRGNRTFHADDIRKMKNGQDEPAMINAGGFNCYHHWEPDPFFKGDKYKVEFYDVMDGRRIVKVARPV